jgi:hypothetical protein
MSDSSGEQEQVQEPHEGGLPPTASAIVTAVAHVGSMEDDPFRLSLLLWLSLEMDLGRHAHGN